jgi:DNA-damage-inducible protein J
MAGTAMVHIRVDEKVKANANAAFELMGISMSDAVRIMLVRVAAEKALPFDVRVPNKVTIRALKDADKKKGKRFKTVEALFEDLGI